jgi:hypothetical protein
MQRAALLKKGPIVSKVYQKSEFIKAALPDKKF